MRNPLIVLAPATPGPRHEAPDPECGLIIALGVAVAFDAALLLLWRLFC